MQICVNHPSVSENVVRCWRCMKSVCPNCRVTLGGKPYCAECKLEQLADLRSGVSQGPIELASIGRRFVALFIDGILLAIPVWIVMLMFIFPVMFKAASTGAKAPPAMPLWFNFFGFAYLPIYIIYEGLMLGARGQTVGKIAMNIKVVTPSGGDISKGQAWGRAVMRNVFISFLALINYLPAFFTQNKTCVHDLVAGTRVVRVNQ